MPNCSFVSSCLNTVSIFNPHQYSSACKNQISDLPFFRFFCAIFASIHTVLQFSPPRTLPLVPRLKICYGSLTHSFRAQTSGLGCCLPCCSISLSSLSFFACLQRLLLLSISDPLCGSKYRDALLAVYSDLCDIGHLPAFPSASVLLRYTVLQAVRVCSLYRPYTTSSWVIPRRFSKIPLLC